jgi:hypothetical protein
MGLLGGIAPGAAKAHLVTSPGFAGRVVAALLLEVTACAVVAAVPALQFLVSDAINAVEEKLMRGRGRWVRLIYARQVVPHHSAVSSPTK